MSPPTSDVNGAVQSDTSSSSGNALFFRAWLRAPLGIASLVPSSQATGRTFARLIDTKREGDILELGSGTGAIGQALLEAGIPAQRLIMVEREPELADYLRQRFPGLRVLQGDATEIGSLLASLDVRRLSTVVSSLPIVWLSLQAQADIIDPCLYLLEHGGPFLQMTNQPVSPVPMKKLGLRGERAATIWRNFPPSFIWRYWRE
jgi:phosphatidylethanolamine/phosphatidyl-N-methylethanolamine N-methyltransferase